MVYTDLFENHHTFFDGPWNSAWLCFYGFWSAFTTMGPYQAFGLIAGYHTETLDRVQLALVGALSGALPYISGPIIDLVLKCWLEQEQGKRPQDSRFRMVVVKCTYGLCATGVALGYGLATRVRHLEMFVVYQGLMVGVFNGYHVASMTNVIEWLNEDELPLALGVISAGASLGGVVYPLWFFFAYSNKDDVKGTNTTLAILSGLSGLLLAILAPVPRCPPVMIQRPSTKRRPLKDIFPRMLGWRMILCIILCGVCEASASFIPLMYRGDFGNLFSYDALEGVCYQSAVNLVGLWFNIWTGMFAPYLSLRRVLAVSVFASPVVILCFWLSSIMLARKDLWIAYLFSSSVLDGAHSIVLIPCIGDICRSYKLSHEKPQDSLLGPNRRALEEFRINFWLSISRGVSGLGTSAFFLIRHVRVNKRHPREKTTEFWPFLTMLSLLKFASLFTVLAMFRLQKRDTRSVSGKLGS